MAQTWSLVKHGLLNKINAQVHPALQTLYHGSEKPSQVVALATMFALAIALHAIVDLAFYFDHSAVYSEQEPPPKLQP